MYHHHHTVYGPLCMTTCGMRSLPPLSWRPLCALRPSVTHRGQVRHRDYSPDAKHLTPEGDLKLRRPLPQAWHDNFFKSVVRERTD